MPRLGPRGASDPRQVCPHLQGPQRIQIRLNIVQVGAEAHVKLLETQPAYSNFCGASVERVGVRRPGLGGALDPRHLSPHLQGPQEKKIRLNWVHQSAGGHIEVPETQPAY